MGGFENEVIEAAIKEAASVAFGGIVTAMALSPLVTYRLPNQRRSTRRVSPYLAFAIKTILTSAQASSTLLVFLLAMVLHPEVQAKAQADIDRVIGKDRLPNFDDRLKLPYVDAILRETLRWHPVTPMGLYTLLQFLKT
jgi:cytochrome P450